MVIIVVVVVMVVMVVNGLKVVIVEIDGNWVIQKPLDEIIPMNNY
jgi:hypothetical protein